jgi:ATP-binding cassette, subfamily B, bacterial PglK
MDIIKTLNSIYKKKELNYFLILLGGGTIVTLLDLISFLFIIPLFNIIFLDQNIIFFNIKIDIVDNNIKVLVIILFVLLFIFKNLLIIYYNYIYVNFFKNIKTRISGELFKKFLNQDYIFLTKDSSKNLLQKITHDVDNLDSLLNAFIILFVEILFVIGILIILFLTNSKIFLLSLFTFSIVGSLYFMLVKNKIKSWSAEYHQNIGIVNNTIIEGMSGFKDIIFYNLKDYFYNKLNSNKASANHFVARLNFLNQIQKYWLEIVGVIIISLSLLYFTIINLDIFELLPILGLFLISMFRLLSSLGKIFATSQNLKFYYPSLQSVKDYLVNLKIKKNIISDEKFNFVKNIKFNNVSFNYTPETPPILKNINLEINKNEFILITGKNGSGKSTFLNLISGFLQPTKGQIIIDDMFDIFQNKEFLIKNSSYVQQNIFLLDTTILNNITLFNDKLIDNNKLNSIIQLLQLKEYFKNLPGNLNYEVGFNGLKLSGGQKQLISLARALYKDSDILFFDEPTSALDKNVKNLFVKSLDLLKGNKTIFIITHETEIFNDYYDRIINIDNNQIFIS